LFAETENRDNIFTKFATMGGEMDALQNMRLFVKVAQSGSFSAAGRLTGLSPASASRRINALEESLGVRLINRTSRKLALTEVGRLYVEKASRILREMEELSNEVSEHQSNPRGLIHVHTRISIGMRYLARALPAFLARYPDVSVKLWLTDDHKDVVEHKIDVAIRLGNLDEPSLTVRKLFAGHERVLFASPRYLASHPPIRQPEDFLTHNCLTYLDGRFDDGSALWRFRDSAGGIKEIRVRGSLQVNDWEGLRLAALADLGIGLLPEWCVGPELASGELCRPLPDYTVTATIFDHSLYAVFHNSEHLPPKVRVFVDFLVDVFKPKAIRQLSPPHRFNEMDARELMTIDGPQTALVGSVAL
jgi:DNA-binding transcriptional LysR family regulator